MPTMRTPRIFVFFLLALTMTACGGKKRSQKDLDDPERGGSALEPISFRYADTKPTVSSDGTKVVFVSGRDSGAATATSKAYKTTWPAGAEPGELTRVTSDDSVGIEKSAWISPDGAWVLLLSADGARTDLYLQDFAGAKPPVRVTDDAEMESLASFSPDGKLISWLATDRVKKTSTARIVEIGDASAATLAKQAKLTDDAKVAAKLVFWLPATTGYRLALATVGVGESLATFVQRSFADLAGASAAADVAWFANFNPDTATMPVVAGDSVLLSRRFLASDNIVYGRIGTEPSETLIQTPVSSEPAWVNVAPGSAVQRYLSIPGTDTLGLGKSADGQTNFLVERHFYSCAGQGANYFGTAFVIGPLDVAGIGTKILPKLDSAGNFVAAAEFCELKLDGVPAWVDDKITEMTVPTSATADKFRIVYTSRFSKIFDKDCLLRAGDTEIMALDVTGEAKTFYPVSKNPAPLKSASRGGNPECVL